MKFNLKLVLLHLLFWVLYLIVWGVRDMAYAPTFWDTLDSNLIGSACYALGVYVNWFVLIPIVLLKGKKLLYSFLVLILTIVVAYITAVAFTYYYIPIHLGTSQFFSTTQGLANTGGDFLVVYALSTSLFFINEWYIKERRLRELESANLRAELDLLKGQINPHFLFNALNSVHVLIRKNPEKALNTLEKFSDLLSHQIYDVEKEFVSLETEVKNLSNFIELQELRFSSHVKVNWQVSGNLTGLRIAPMLFLNFVENAFKHGSTASQTETTIDILLKVESGWLEFSCVNSMEAGKEEQRSGKGLANAKRRLELLYPKRHQLEIEKRNNEFSVSLQIKLNED